MVMDLIYTEINRFGSATGRMPNRLFLSQKAYDILGDECRHLTVNGSVMGLREFAGLIIVLVNDYQPSDGRNLDRIMVGEL